MKQIPLTLDKEAVIDDEDYDLIGQYTWHASKNRNTWYAWTNVKHPDRPGYTRMAMHQLVIGGRFRDGQQVDHIDGNGLNNLRSNLRLVTIKQNMANRSAVKNSTSPYKGVHRDKHTNKWRAQIRIDGKQKHLGVFADAEDAAMAYDEAAIAAHGEFARINVKSG